LISSLEEARVLILNPGWKDDGARDSRIFPQSTRFGRSGGDYCMQREAEGVSAARFAREAGSQARLPRTRQGSPGSFTISRSQWVQWLTK
jgi:hypothetical protein